MPELPAELVLELLLTTLKWRENIQYDWSAVAEKQITSEKDRKFMVDVWKIIEHGFFSIRKIVKVQKKTI